MHGSLMRQDWICPAENCRSHEGRSKCWSVQKNWSEHETNVWLVSCSSPPRARSSRWHEYEKVFIIMSILKRSNDSFSYPNQTANFCSSSASSTILSQKHFRARWSDGGRFQELRTAWSLTSRSKSSRARTKVHFVPLRNVLVPPRDADDDDGTNVLETNCK